jgi:hypothetical protein
MVGQWLWGICNYSPLALRETADVISPPARVEGKWKGEKGGKPFYRI